MRYFLTTIATVLRVNARRRAHPPAFAAKSGSWLIFKTTTPRAVSALQASRGNRCKGGRLTAMAAAGGCDYYVYSYDYSLGRR